MDFLECIERRQAGRAEADHPGEDKPPQRPFSGLPLPTEKLGEGFFTRTY